MPRKRKPEIVLGLIAAGFASLAYFNTSYFIYLFMVSNYISPSFGVGIPPKSSLLTVIASFNFPELFSLVGPFLFFLIFLAPIAMLIGSVVKLRTHHSQALRMAGLSFLFSFILSYYVTFDYPHIKVYYTVVGFAALVFLLAITGRRRFSYASGVSALIYGAPILFIYYIFTMQIKYAQLPTSVNLIAKPSFVIDLFILLAVSYVAAVGLALGSSRLIYGSRKLRKERKKEGIDAEEEADSIYLVGFSGGGKTVFTALLLFFAPSLKGIPGYSYVVEESSNAMISSLSRLLSGSWPESNRVQETRTGTSMVVQKRTRARIERAKITINDMSGELWRDLSNNNNVREVLSRYESQTPTIKNLPNASGYIVTIEAVEPENWAYKQMEYIDLFRIIHAVNRSKVLNKKVAVIFTKCDTLPSNYKSITAEEMLRTGMPLIYNYLKQHFDLRQMTFLKSGLRVDDNKNPKIFTINGKKTLMMDGDGGLGPFESLVRWALNT